MRRGKRQLSYLSLFLQVAIYYNKYFDIAYFISTVLAFVYKGLWSVFIIALIYVCLMFHDVYI